MNDDFIGRDGPKRHRAVTEIRAILGDHRQSGLSLVAFARHHQLCHASLLRWRSRYTSEGGQTGSHSEFNDEAVLKPRFVPVRMDSSIRSLTFFRSGALSVKGLELVVGKRHLCGELSPESALAILQKTPPDAVWPHDQTHAITSIFGPSAGTNFLERRFLKALENSIGHP